MERKIGEIFEYNGEWYQCVESDGTCNGCVGTFQSYSFCNDFEECVGKIFKKIEKVGEPYEFDGHLFQSYRTFEVPIFTENYSTVRELGNNSKISIEIKQNKEDMEEKKIQHYDCFFGKKKSNLKPFDIQKAREGKPVCTRDGRKARIICFDRKDNTPIVALIECVNHTEILQCVHNDGKCFHYDTSNNDLMMLPEKKEGWVNLYREEDNTIETSMIRDNYDDAKTSISSSRNYITTVKIQWEE